ncbi:MAG: hypothetical protein AAF411_04855 [Myxococcota bacterium]
MTKAYPTWSLVFGDMPIATIVQDDADFPTLFGTYTLTEGAERSAEGAERTAEGERIHAYIAMSIRVFPLYEEGRDDEAADEEEAFMDLIESEQWALIDAEGQRRSILIPVFSPGGRVNWRWAR